MSLTRRIEWFPLSVFGRPAPCDVLYNRPCEAIWCVKHRTLLPQVSQKLPSILVNESDPRQIDDCAAALMGWQLRPAMRQLLHPWPG